MIFDQPITTGKLIKRYKRFLADVELDNGSVVTAHVPNTGSMKSTNETGSPVALSYHPKPTRKLKWTLELIQVRNCWVGVNTMKSNYIVAEAIEEGLIEPLKGYDSLRREVPYGEKSRIDILLQKENERCYVEVKNVTYKKDNSALFPDAVTARGTKHLVQLQSMVEQGHRAVLFFLVNRNDCTQMAPAKSIDPTYAETLKIAIQNGVEALVYGVCNTLEGSSIDRPLTLSLNY